MNWKPLTELTALETIKKDSFTQPVLLFKHSTRCSISSTALARLERAWKETEMPTTQVYLLDLLNYRQISNQIAQDFGVVHESPQALLIVNGICVYCAAHHAIVYQEMKQQVNLAFKKQ